MALFIQPENQNILWEMVNKIPLCSTVFPVSQKNEKQNWFKGIIGDFYKRIPQNISRNDLYQINRDVLAAMMKSLGELSSSAARQNTMDRGIFSKLDMNSNSTIETKKTDYEIRQAQYTNMFEIQKPKAIDFSEKLDDDIITNMNELIENQRKIRELDLQQFAPKPTEAIQNIKVNILEDIPKEVIQPQVIKGSKQVHFNLAEEQHQDIIKSNEIMELKQKIENMDDKINQMFEMLRTLISPPPIISNDVLEVDKINESVSENVETIKQMMTDSNQ
jgi:hypothetical protein